MDGYSQIIVMSKQVRKILFFIFIISILSFFIFWGLNYTKINLASLSGIITAWVTINPLEVDVSASSEVEMGKVFKVTAKVINKGEEKIENAKAEIFLPSELVLIQKDSVKKIGIIPPKKEQNISWLVKGVEIGNYVISVKASGELKGQLITAEDSATVVIKETTLPDRGHRFDFFQRFFNSFREWLSR